MKKIWMCLMLAVLLSSNVFALDNVIDFTDVDSSYWGYEAINQMANDGVIVGYEDKTFKPNKPISRAEFAKMISKAFNISHNAKEQGYAILIDDVDFDHWASDYVQSTFRYFPVIVEGRNVFEPNEPITREDAAYTLVKLLFPDEGHYNRGALDKFSDENEVTEAKKGYVEVAVSKGIMNGNGDNTLNPKGSLTRAQVCTLLYNIKYKLNLYEEFLNFSNITKYVEIAKNLNGEEKDKVTVEVIFDISAIKKLDFYVQTTDNRRLESTASYGRTQNEEYLGKPNAIISFYASSDDEYRIYVTRIETLDGKRSNNVEHFIIYSPQNRLKIETNENTITKKTKFSFKWGTQYPAPSNPIKWHINNSNLFGIIDNNTFSVEDDILKTINKKQLDKTFDVTIIAEDNKTSSNAIYVYKYNIFDLKKF